MDLLLFLSSFPGWIEPSAILWLYAWTILSVTGHGVMANAYVAWAAPPDSWLRVVEFRFGMSSQAWW